MDGNRHENDEQVVDVWRVNKDRLTWMEHKIADTPRILSRSAGKSSCCIFKVPESLIEINGRCYHPHIVSVGPYHHGDPRLKMIEEHKWRFLGTLLKRTQSKGLTLEDLLQAVQPLEAQARECYSASISFSTDEFVEILAVDGCFVIELFRKFGGVVAFEADDPLLSLSWVYSFFLRDLIRLENQIPFLVLRRLFELTKMPSEESAPSLSKLALQFFNNGFQRSEEFVDKCESLAGKHVLDLLRTSFIPEGRGEPRATKFSNTHVIQCISKLRRAGVKLRAGREESFLEIRFRRGVIEMPKLTIDDFTSSFLLNCVAYEQCSRSCSKHMTTYATLLDCLINTAKDVEYLSDMNIIENYFGTDAEMARFINNMGKDVSFDIDMCYLSELFNEVNHYYSNHWHVHWASFKYTYFKNQNMATFEASHQYQPATRVVHNEHDSKIDMGAAETRSSYQYWDRVDENWTESHEAEEENRYMNDYEDDDSHSMGILKGLLKEVDVKGHKVLNKLVAKIEKEVPMERVLHDVRGKVGSEVLEKIVRKLNKGGRDDEEVFVRRERGTNGDILQENKLERFKVKTVNTIGSGVVKEEEH